ncbi:MAG: hypothetical protein K2X97_05430, partial [Mycobacteriaceae bacterium]|nr:hypothetical protein [Mycobacteriaceae bacterium]
MAASLPLDPRFADIVFLFDMHEALYGHYAVLTQRSPKLASLVAPLKVLKKGKFCFAQVTVDFSNPKVNALFTATEQGSHGGTASRARSQSNPGQGTTWTVPFNNEEIDTLLDRSFWALPVPAEREREFSALRPGQPFPIHIFRCVLHFIYAFDLPSEVLKSLSIVDLATLYATAIRCELEDLRLITLVHWRSMLNDENIFLSLSVSTAAQLGGLVSASLAYCLRNSREFLLRRRHQQALGLDLLRSTIEVLAAHDCMPLRTIDSTAIAAHAAIFDDYAASPAAIDDIQTRRGSAQDSIREMFLRFHQSLN